MFDAVDPRESGAAQLSDPVHLMRGLPLVLAVTLVAGCAHTPTTGRRNPGRISTATERAVVPTSPTGGAPDSAQVVAMLAGMQNAACPLAGIATGGQPDSSQLIALQSRGYRTVLDLRAPGEPRGMDEAAVARAAGLAYCALPVTPATLTDSTFGAFRAIAADPGNHPMLVHCASGNRVGAVMIPWLVLDRGWSVERAVATANAGGLHSAELRDRALDYVTRHTSGGK